MSKLPIVSWRKVVKALRKAGFQVERQNGSHLILAKKELIVAVPKQKQLKQLKRGLLMAIIEEPGLTKDEFLKLLKKLELFFNQ